SWSPFSQIRYALRLNGVLVERIAVAAADVQLLSRRHESGGHRQPVQFRPEAVDNLVRRSRPFALAVAEGFEGDKEKASVARSSSARECHYVRHRGIGLDYVYELQQREPHD